MERVVGSLVTVTIVSFILLFVILIIVEHGLYS